MTPSLVIGVDLGGTKIEAVLARRGSGGELEVLERTRVSNLDVFYDEGARRASELVFNDELTTPILRNALGDSAGVFGAALMAR